MCSVRNAIKVTDTKGSRGMSELLAEDLYEHYRKYLGVPIRTDVFEPLEPGPKIQILSYEKVFEGCIAFSTFGASHYAEELGHRVELFVVADDGFEQIPYILASLVFRAVETRLDMRRGARICGIESVDSEFERRFAKNAIYFTVPFFLPEAFAKVYSAGAEVSVLQGIFVDRKEFSLVGQIGVDAFEERMEQASIDPFAISRTSFA